MVTCTIRVTEKHVDSKAVSIQQEHAELYVKGQLYSILLCDKENNLLYEYEGPELARLIGSAISRGRRVATNRFTGASEFYFLGDR